MKIRTIALMALLAGSVSLGCTHRPANKRRGAVVERLPQVEVAQPERKRLIRRLELAATVESLKKVDLSARVPGIVGQLPDEMDIGRRVNKGDVLLTLAVPELEADREHKQALLLQAHKQEKLAQESLVVARREVEETQQESKRYQAEVDFHTLRHARIRDLVRQRAQDPAVEQEAQKQLESARASLASNKARTAKQQARVQAATAELELARQRIKVAEAELRKLNETIGFATIKAPFDGVITRRWVDPGAVIKDSGAVLFTLMEMDRVRVLIDIPQRDAAVVNSREQNPNPDGQGDPVKVRFPSLAGVVKNGEFPGHITRMSRALDPVTRTMRAEIELDNKHGYLRPGMFGSATVVAEDRSRVVSVPASALVRQGDGLVEVYVVADVTGEGDERRGVLRRMPVVLGIDDGKEVEIREGLKGDEWVVSRVSGSLRVGDRVIALSERDALGEK